MKNEEIKGEFKAKGIQKAKEKLDRMKLDEESIKSYDRYINDKRDELSSMNTYKLDLKYAREKGYKKGLVEGIKINTAKKMLSANQDINFIAEISGLSIAEIKEIKCKK